MFRSFHATGHSCGSRLKDEHISTRSCPSACPCHPVSLRTLRRQPLFPWESRAFTFSTTSTTGSYLLSLGISCANTGTWCSHTSACWAFGQLEQKKKEQTLPDTEDLFSGYGVGFGRTDSTPHTGTCSVGVELPEYVQEQDGGPTETVSEAPGAYGSCCSSQATGAASYKTVSTLACLQTFTPWLDLAFLRAGVPLEQVSRHAVVYTDAYTTGWGATYNGHAVSGFWTGPQLHWHTNCLEQYALPWTISEGAYEASTCWSARTTLRPLRTSTDKVVYAPVATVIGPRRGTRRQIKSTWIISRNKSTCKLQCLSAGTAW